MGFSKGLPILIILSAIILLGAYVISILTGAGGIQRMTTISGIYAVERPDGYPVICFVEKSSGSMQCISEAQLKGPSAD